jgi:hypothetical protein
MSYQTPQGRAYTLTDLKRLAGIEAFGQYTGAIKGMVERLEFLEAEYARLSKETLTNQGYREQLLQLRAEVNGLKKQ